MSIRTQKVETFLRILAAQMTLRFFWIFLESVSSNLEYCQYKILGISYFEQFLMDYGVYLDLVGLSDILSCLKMSYIDVS